MKVSLQQAVDSAVAVMEADGAVSSVEIEFTTNGRDYTATYAGYVRNIQRKNPTADEAAADRAGYERFLESEAMAARCC